METKTNNQEQSLIAALVQLSDTKKITIGLVGCGVLAYVIPTVPFMFFGDLTGALHMAPILIATSFNALANCIARVLGDKYMTVGYALTVFVVAFTIAMAVMSSSIGDVQGISRAFINLEGIVLLNGWLFSLYANAVNLRPRIRKSKNA